MTTQLHYAQHADSDSDSDLSNHSGLSDSGSYSDLLSARIDVGCDPAALAVRLARAGVVDTYVVYEQGGRWSFAGGVAASVTVGARVVRTVWATGARETEFGDAHPVVAMGDALRGLPFEDWHVYGWVAFESALPAALRRVDAGQPLAYGFVPRVEVRIEADHVEVRCVDGSLLERVLAVVEGAEVGDEAGGTARPLDVEAEGPEAYQWAVSAAVRRIRLGELEKVILSRPVEVPFELDFPGTYLAGRRANTPARSFLLDLPHVRAAGFSPETVAEVSAEGWVTSQPLAGTRARHAEMAADLRSRAELTTDPKEVYEHAVSVKLADTELRSLCAPGTVRVGEFMAMKERGSVRHLGSRVSGRLRADRTAWDALAALFPAVTASGIPKSEAYDVIAELESEPRGLYSGAVVRATSEGELDAALALRTVYTRGGRTWLRAGAGIVSASRPEREYRETCEKLASVAPYLVPLTPHAE